MNPQKKISWYISWPIIILAFFLFWPVGVVLLIMRLGADRGKQMVIGLYMLIVGWFITIISGLILIAAIFAKSQPDTTPVVILFCFFLVGGIFLISKGRNLRKQGNLTKQYIDLIVNKGLRSVDNIASTLGSQDTNKVMAEIKSVIDKGFLPGFSIDHQTRSIEKQTASVEPPAVSQEGAAAPISNKISFTCRACGANNQVIALDVTEAHCEYCDTAAHL